MANGSNAVDLNDLLQSLAAHLVERLKGEDALDKDGEKVRLPPSPAILKEIRELLKDNSITCLPSNTNPIGALTSGLPFPAK